MRPINSMVVFKQIVGRGSRICEEKGKLSFRIFDYVVSLICSRGPGI